MIPIIRGRQITILKQKETFVFTNSDRTLSMQFDFTKKKNKTI